MVTPGPAATTKGDRVANGNGNGSGNAALQRAIWWVLSALVGGMGYLLVQIIEVQASRFTAEDGKEVWQEIADIREALGKKADRDEVPPDEVIRWLQRHDREIGDLRKDNH